MVKVTIFFNGDTEDLDFRENEIDCLEDNYFEHEVNFLELPRVGDSVTFKCKDFKIEKVSHNLDHNEISVLLEIDED